MKFKYLKYHYVYLLISFKKYIPLLLLSFFTTLLILIPYIKEIIPRIITALLLCLFPVWQFLSFKKYQTENSKISFLTNFLELFSNELQGGYTASHSLKNLNEYYKNIKSLPLFARNWLNSLENQINLKVGQTEIFKTLSKMSFHPQCELIFNLLYEQSKLQAPIEDLVIRLCQILRAEELNHEDFKNQLYKQKLEAIILLATPFCLAFFLNITYPHFLNQAHNNIVGKILLFLSLSISLAAIFITNKFTSFSRNIFNNTQNQNKYSSIQKNKAIFIYLKKYYLKMLNYFSIKLVEFVEKKISLQQINIFFRARAWQEGKSIMYMQALNEELKFTCLTLLKNIIPIFSLSIFFCFLSQKLIFLLICPTYAFYKLKIFKKDADKYVKDIELNYALYLGILIALLKSSFVPRLAFEKSLNVFKNQPNFLWREITYTLSDSKNPSTTFNQRLNKWLSFLPMNEVQNSIKVLLQYLENGSDSLLNLLEYQLEQLWRKQRDIVKKEMEQKSILLFLPMLLNLLAIILFILAPLTVQFLNTT